VTATTLEIRTQAFVDGTYVDALSAATFDCVNPATGETLAQVAACGADDVDRAVRGARAAFESASGRAWRRSGASACSCVSPS